MAQLMPLPLTVFFFSKIQIGFTFLVPAHPGSPGQRAVKRLCVSVINLSHVDKYTLKNKQATKTNTTFSDFTEQQGCIQKLSVAIQLIHIPYFSGMPLIF